MAQVDTSIYGNLLRPPKSVAEYDAERTSGQTNRLALMLGQQKADEYTRGIADAAQERQIVGGFGSDREANYNALLKGGRLQSAQEYAKQNAAIGEVGAKTAHSVAQTSKADAEAGNLAAQQHRDALGPISDPQGAANWVRALYSDPRTKAAVEASGSTVEQALSRIPQDPAGFAEWKMRSSLGAEKLIAQTSPDANARLSSQTSLTTNANNNATTQRGQDLTDSRAREFNATTVEANNIKRSEVQQTKDMTKGGQLASFDTMLGTLDRLSTHPGLSRSVGAMGALPTMPGSDSANFQAELNTFQSQAFLPMVAQLKGMGALSDAEGKKLTQAVGALDTKMGEKAIRESIGRITTEMVSARDRVSGIKSAPASGSFSDQSKESRYQAWKAKQ